MPKKTEKRVESRVLVSEGWIAGLLSTAQKVVDTIDNIEPIGNAEIIAKSNVYALLGYVQSARSIIPSQGKGKKKANSH